MKVRKAFTLIELILVIAIIVVIATSSFVVMNPAKRFAETRNARRLTDVQNLLIAIKANQTYSGGTYLAAIQSLTVGLSYVIGTNTTGCSAGCTATATQSSCVNLADLVAQSYLDSVPFDPLTGSEEFSDYYFMRNSVGIISIGVCDAELGEIVKVSR